LQFFVNFGLKMSDDSNFDCENNINETAKAYCDNLLPVAGKVYEKVFREFEAWCNRKKVKQVTEEVVLVYIGGWKSTSVAEGYIENSIQNKINIAKKIQNQEVGNSFNQKKRLM
jgi:flavorubredoxin